MNAFPQAIQAQIDGANVRAAALVGFDFRSGWKGYWSGFGPIRTSAGAFEGTGNLGSLSPIEAGQAGGIDEMTFAIAGPPEMLARFNEDREETDGRTVQVYLQFLDARKQDEQGRFREWNTLDDPLVIFTGTMGPLSVSRPPGSGDERPTVTMSVRAQNIWSNRRRPAFGFFSDLDQKARSAGDNIFALCSKNGQVDFNWPQFPA